MATPKDKDDAEDTQARTNGGRKVRKRTRAESAALQQAIIDEFKKGEMSQVDISVKFGVSRAYVGIIVTNWRRGGTGSKPAVRKGPPDETERAELVKAMRGSPAAAGVKGEKEWTIRLAKKWFRGRFGRMIYQRDLEYLIKEERLKVRSLNRADMGGFIEFGDTGERKRPPGRPPLTGYSSSVAKVGEINIKTLQRALRIDEETARALMANTLAPLSGPPKPAPSAAAAPKGVPVKAEDKIGRNDSCPKGRPLKFKQCCGKRGLKSCDGMGPK